jgi:hypothetical protein
MAVIVKQRPIGHILGSAITATVNEQYGGFASVYDDAHGLVDGDYVYIQSNIGSYNGFWYVNAEGVDWFKIRRNAIDTDQAFVVSASVTYYKATNSHGWNCVHLPIVYKLKTDLASGSDNTTQIVQDVLSNLFTNSEQESTAAIDWTDTGTPEVELTGAEASEKIGFPYSFTAGVTYNITHFITQSPTDIDLTTVTVYLYDDFSGGSFTGLVDSLSYPIPPEIKEFSFTPSANASYIVFKIEKLLASTITFKLGQTTISYETEVPLSNFRAINSYGNDNGYVNLNIAGSIDDGAYPEPFEYIRIEGTSELDGIYQIVEVVSTTSLTINLVYLNSYSFSGGEVSRYYNNYNFVVKVYGGLQSGHTWGLTKPMELLATLYLPPDDSGEVMFSINEILKSQVLIKNNLQLDSLPNNIDAFTKFYISYGEQYDDTFGSQYDLGTFRSEFTDDTFIGTAVNALLPFKNIHAGSLSDYFASAKFLTLFPSLKYYPDIYQDVSVLITDDDTHKVNVSGSETTLSTYDAGVYRVPITGTGIYSIYKGSTKLSENLTVSASDECDSRVIYLTWLNYLGGFEYFKFVSEKEYAIDIEDDGETNINTFPNWPNSYGEYSDTIRKQTFRQSRNSIRVTSQHVTEAELEALKYIKTSPLVQIIEARDDKRTVIVDTNSFTVKRDRQRLFDITFVLTYTDTIPSQR